MFGPSRGLTPASTCPWVDHLASRLLPLTERPVQTRFRYGSARRFASPVTVTSRLIMQKARGQAFRTEVRHSPPTACRHTVSGTLSLPSQGCFSPFPHGTGSLSVAREYLALRDGPRRFPRDFTCPAVLRVPVGASTMSSTGLSPSMAGRSRPFDYRTGF